VGARGGFRSPNFQATTSVFYRRPSFTKGRSKEEGSRRGGLINAGEKKIGARDQRERARAYQVLGGGGNYAAEEARLDLYSKAMRRRDRKKDLGRIRVNCF